MNILLVSLLCGLIRKELGSRRSCMVRAMIRSHIATLRTLRLPAVQRQSVFTGPDCRQDSREAYMELFDRE